MQKAIYNKFITVSTINPRDYSDNKHRKVDDTISGGGCGMLLSPQPLFSCLKTIKDSHIIILSPAGKKFCHKDAKVLSKYKKITLICGRYEGIDERVVEAFGDEIYCVGDMVLTGGELPALMICDAISRYIPGVLGNVNSTDEESFESNIVEYPSFTKPAIFNTMATPAILLQGHHKHITKWREKSAIAKTKYAHPLLYSSIKSQMPLDKERK